MIEQGKEHWVLYFISVVIIFVCIILAVWSNKSEKHPAIKVQIVEESQVTNYYGECNYEKM